MNPQPIIIAENFEIFRIGIKTILEKTPEFAVIDDVGSALELIASYKKNPDAVCLAGSSIQDLSIYDLFTRLKKINPEPKFIVFSHASGPKHLDIALKAGVNGYITRHTQTAELIRIVTDVADGKNAFCASVTSHIIDRYKNTVKKPRLKKYKITRREREILGYIVKGCTSPEIAEKLYISPRTVETHRANLLNKLKPKNTAALVRYAIQEENLPDTT